MVASPRAWVDFISNLLTMDWLCVGLEIDQEAQLTDDRLRTFLHEHTHFTSFGYPVGLALSTTYKLIVEATYHPDILARAQKRGRDDPLVRLVQNLRAAIIMFEGLAEGLALFAEWDALPGRSPTASPGMTTAFTFYHLKRPPGTDDPWNTLRKTVQDVRWGPDAVQAKTNLLAQPIAGNQGHYLLGYLCIKALYLQALERTARFSDSDLFVLFANRIVFDNPCVAAHIYAVDQPFDEWLEKLQKLTVSGMRSVLWSDDLDRRVQEFEEALANEAMVPEDRAPVIASVMGGQVSDWELPERHAERAARLVTADAGQWARGFSAQEFGEYLAAFFRARSMLRLRHLQADAVVGSGKVVFRDGGKIVAECPMEHGVVDGGYPNSAYSLYYLPERQCFIRIALCHQDGPLVLGWEVYRHREAEGLPDIGLVRAYVLSACVVEGGEFNDKKPGGPSEVMALADAFLTAHEKQSVRQSCLNLAAFCLWGEEQPGKQPERLELLNPVGIFGWLGKERPVREAAVRSSLAASRDPDIAAIELAMTDCDLTLSEWLEHIERTERSLELPLHASFTSGSTRALIFGF